MITNLVNEKLIINDLNANNKSEVFEELAQILFINNKISSKSDFLADINAREELSVTSMDGIAYPHAKSQSVIEPAIAVGIKREGIDYGDEEGIEPTLFFMIASPDNGADHHIYVLQELFGRFCEEFIEKLNKSTSESETLKILINS
jgi:PTS system fructose-specific IIA component